jgi:NADH:ubiquinone reductase (H+-translocating)
MTAAQSKLDNLPRVVALGGGYGSIFLYKQLAGMVRRKKIRLTVIDRNNFNCYHGLVPEMLAGKISPGTVISPLRTIFRGAQFRNGVIEKIDLEQKEVLFSRALDGKQFTIGFDHLFLNLGSAENLSLFPGIREHTLRLKAFPDIIQARHHLITMLELADIEDDPVEIERLLNFVVAGANYAGVEVATELADFLPRVARKRFPNIKVDQIRITLIHSGDHVLPELGKMLPKLQEYAERTINNTPHIRLLTNARLASATTEEALLNTGERIPTRSIISCTGTTFSPLLDTLPFERDRSGRLVTDPFCRVKGSDFVWAAGDCAAVPRRDGTSCPPLAIWALTAGRQAAINIKATLTGRPLEAYHFTGLGDACTLGNWRAAGHLKGFAVRGLLGYISWRIFAILYLPAWEKKVRVVFDWLLASFFGRDLINMNIHRPVGVTQVMYEPGQDIVREGDVGQSLFIIRTGEVEVFKNAANGQPPELLATLGAGDHFGEVAVFRQMRRTATVRAKTRVELLHVRREAALALSESSAQIAQSLSK